MATKDAKWTEIYKHFPFQGAPNYTQMVFFWYENKPSCSPGLQFWLWKLGYKNSITVYTEGKPYTLTRFEPTIFNLIVICYQAIAKERLWILLCFVYFLLSSLRSHSITHKINKRYVKIDFGKVFFLAWCGKTNPIQEKAEKDCERFCKWNRIWKAEDNRDSSFPSFRVTRLGKFCGKYCDYL
jgi:hypothetical protein